MILTLLPVLIGYTGGRLVHGQRGAVVGAVATMGVVVGTDIPMFLGAMIIGPLAAYLLKLIDGVIAAADPRRVRDAGRQLQRRDPRRRHGDPRPPGRSGRSSRPSPTAAGNGVDFLVDTGLLPLVSIIVEPAKVLFLNNAINHGVLGPLGVAQALESGKSILFMIETNPGPGLGILLAYCSSVRARCARARPGRSSSTSSAASTRSTSRTC